MDQYYARGASRITILNAASGRVVATQRTACPNHSLTSDTFRWSYELSQTYVHTVPPNLPDACATSE
jgi:hypothetical protein